MDESSRCATRRGRQRSITAQVQTRLATNQRDHKVDRNCIEGVQEGEAQLIHLACSQAPDGCQRWTLELLADQMVCLGYVEHISPETVRTRLQKTN